MTAGEWPASLNTEELRNLARLILPDDWNTLSMAAREQIGASIRREAQTKIAYRQKQKTITPWRISEMPIRVSTTWDRIVRYKTDAFPEKERVTCWSLRGTVDRNWGILHQFFSVMALPLEDGGLGIPVEQLTFGLLACPVTFQTFAKWHFERGGGKLNTGARVWCGLLGHLTAAETQTKARVKTNVAGFLHVCPELAYELEVIPGVVRLTKSRNCARPMDGEQHWRNTPLRSGSSSTCMKKNCACPAIRLSRSAQF